MPDTPPHPDYPAGRERFHRVRSPFGGLFPAPADPAVRSAHALEHIARRLDDLVAILEAPPEEVITDPDELITDTDSQERGLAYPILRAAPGERVVVLMGTSPLLLMPENRAVVDADLATFARRLKGDRL